MTQPDRSTASILWGQVFGLAMIQGAITLAWVVYNLYLVQLLTALGFSAALSTGILILENLLAMITEPLMGTLSDQLQHRIGTRFPVISLGVILSAGLLLSLPTGLIWGQAGLRWLLPVLMVAWALAMTVFRSPALSLLGRYALRTQLPQAASILTLVGGLAGAMGPLANQFILDIGAMAAFAIGSGVLLLAAAVLWWVGPNASLPSLTSAATAPPLRALPWQDLAWVFGAGAGVALGFRMVMTTFPAVIKQQVVDAQVGMIMGAIFVTLALVAIPAGTLATRIGNRRAIILGLAGMTLAAAVMIAVQSHAFALVLSVLFGGAFSLVSNGTVPFALSLVPPERAGLATGMYFSGGGLASSLFGLLSLSAALSFGVGVLAFVIAGICVARAGRFRGAAVPSA